ASSSASRATIGAVAMSEAPPATPKAAALAAAPAPESKAVPAAVAPAPQPTSAAAPAAAVPSAPTDSAEPPAKVEEGTADAKEVQAKARSFLEKRKLADAIEAGEQSVALDPTDSESWLILGAAYQEKGSMAEARRAYTSCVKEGKTDLRQECAKMIR